MVVWCGEWTQLRKRKRQKLRRSNHGQRAKGEIHCWVCHFFFHNTASALWGTWGRAEQTLGVNIWSEEGIRAPAQTSRVDFSSVIHICFYLIFDRIENLIYLAVSLYILRHEVYIFICFYYIFTHRLNQIHSYSAAKHQREAVEGTVPVVLTKSIWMPRAAQCVKWFYR